MYVKWTYRYISNHRISASQVSKEHPAIGSWERVGPWSQAPLLLPDGSDNGILATRWNQPIAQVAQGVGGSGRFHMFQQPRLFRQPRFCSLWKIADLRWNLGPCMSMKIRSLPKLSTLAIDSGGWEIPNVFFLLDIYIDVLVFQVWDDKSRIHEWCWKWPQEQCHVAGELWCSQNPAARYPHNSRTLRRGGIFGTIKKTKILAEHCG